MRSGRHNQWRDRHELGVHNGCNASDVCLLALGAACVILELARQVEVAVLASAACPHCRRIARGHCPARVALAAYRARACGSREALREAVARALQSRWHAHDLLCRALRRCEAAGQRRERVGQLINTRSFLRPDLPWPSYLCSIYVIVALCVCAFILSPSRRRSSQRGHSRVSPPAPPISVPIPLGLYKLSYCFAAHSHPALSVQGWARPLARAPRIPRSARRSQADPLADIASRIPITCVPHSRKRWGHNPSSSSYATLPSRPFAFRAPGSARKSLSNTTSADLPPGAFTDARAVPASMPSSSHKPNCA